MTSARYPRLFAPGSADTAVFEEIKLLENWKASVRPPSPEFRCIVTVKGVEWRVYHVSKDGKPGTLVHSERDRTYSILQQDGLLTEEQVVAILNSPYEVHESTHHPLDPYTPEERKRINEEAWARAEEYGPMIKGPFIGPWIEHSHHKFSRAWHPALGGGGPAAVVQGTNMRFKWYAFNNLCGNASGESLNGAEQAMAAADKFLAEDVGCEWVRYPLIATLRVEASPWALLRNTDDQWIRTWEGWSVEKVTAAHIHRAGEEFHFRCWLLYPAEAERYGKAGTLELAKEQADATLREYCRATEAV